MNAPASSPPGSEERHYLVFAPGTEPLGRETDVCMTEAFADLVGGAVEWMILIIRIADPAQAQQPGDLWRRVRIYPKAHTYKSLGDFRFGCSGHARQLDPSGMDDGPELPFSAEFKIVDETPRTILGELRITL